MDMHISSTATEVKEARSEALLLKGSYHTVNELCKYLVTLWTSFLSWLVGWCGGRLVPDGCRVIPVGHFSFDPAIVELLGGSQARDRVAKAIIYQVIQSWIESNHQHGRNERDGQTWSYNTYSQWAEAIPFFHQKTIEKHIRDLEALGMLASRAFNKRKGNRTKWYTSPLRLLDGFDVRVLWSEREALMVGVKDSVDSSMNYGAIHNAPMPQEKTPTPARAHDGGVFSMRVETKATLPSSQIAEAQLEIDEHEMAIPFVDISDWDDVYAPPPFRDPPPDYPTDVTVYVAVNGQTLYGPVYGHETETETVSSGDTPPLVAVNGQPEWVGIFTAVDWEIQKWLDHDRERLEAWCKYAQVQENVQSPGGLVRTFMRGKSWPRKQKRMFDYSDGQSYITGKYADFIEH